MDGKEKCISQDMTFRPKPHLIHLYIHLDPLWVGQCLRCYCLGNITRSGSITDMKRTASWIATSDIPQHVQPTQDTTPHGLLDDICATALLLGPFIKTPS